MMSVILHDYYEKYVCKSTTVLRNISVQIKSIFNTNGFFLKETYKVFVD